MLESLSGSCRNLAGLLDGGSGGLAGGGPLSFPYAAARYSRTSLDSSVPRPSRMVFVSMHLPIKATRKEDGSGWSCTWDQDALIVQAEEGLVGMDAVYVGCLSVDVPSEEQEEVARELDEQFNAYPVFLSPDLKTRFYNGFCKQQLWPLFHYLLPLSPHSTGRFNTELWSAYVRANQEFRDRLVEVVSLDDDYVWVHDYHLLVLPSLLRRRLLKVRCGFFLHSPFPSSEVFRTFPKREEVLRALLNADLVGFHTFDYARHFLSCCSRVLGLEHQTKRGSIILEYYGRNVGIKIMPTGVKPERFLGICHEDDTKWRRGELLSEFKGKTVLIGVDDMDIFKGIELKLEAVEHVLEQHPELRGQLVLIQITNAARSINQEMADYVSHLANRINARYGTADYQPVVLLQRPVPLYERVAFYSIADVAVVTATRDGMNLVPYEYIVARQGVEANHEDKKQSSMLVVSEFVGCSPSLSGAIRVNPWCAESVADGIYSAIKMPLEDRQMRHLKHWRYISQHTVAYWAQSFSADLARVTSQHAQMKVYRLGLGLDSFKTVSLMPNFRKLDLPILTAAYNRSNVRVLLLDYDGTLISSSPISNRPTTEVQNVLSALCADPRNTVYVISGRSRAELGHWFSAVQDLGLAAEHGFYQRRRASEPWEVSNDHPQFNWKEIVHPILQVYVECTDGSWIEAKESALVWHYGDADPDFGHWQAKELLDHLEGVLSNEPVEVTTGQGIVEVKPQGVSKGAVVDGILSSLANSGKAPDLVLCIGDDRSDEDMFAALENVTFMPHMPAEVFACTVGQKPSRAGFYVNDPPEILSMLAHLANSQQNNAAEEVTS